MRLESRRAAHSKQKECVLQTLLGPFFFFSFLLADPDYNMRNLDRGTSHSNGPDTRFEGARFCFAHFCEANDGS